MRWSARDDAPQRARVACVGGAVIRDFVLDVLDTMNRIDAHSMLFWRTDDRYEPIAFFMDCNDVFAWGGADGESITPESLPILKQAIADVQAL